MQHFSAILATFLLLELQVPACLCSVAEHLISVQKIYIHVVLILAFYNVVMEGALLHSQIPWTQGLSEIVTLHWEPGWFMCSLGLTRKL